MLVAEHTGIGCGDPKRKPANRPPGGPGGSTVVPSWWSLPPRERGWRAPARHCGRCQGLTGRPALAGFRLLCRHSASAAHTRPVCCSRCTCAELCPRGHRPIFPVPRSPVLPPLHGWKTQMQQPFGVSVVSHLRGALWCWRSLHAAWSRLWRLFGVCLAPLWARASAACCGDLGREGNQRSQRHS